MNIRAILIADASPFSGPTARARNMRRLIKQSESQITPVTVQGRKVFAGASEGELNSAAGSQICGVDTVPALPDGADDRCH